MSMWFLYTNICKIQILGKFWADVRVQHVMWPRDRWSDFRKLGIKRCVRLERKTHAKACRDLRRSRGSRGFRTGGGSIWPPPPPPAQIGLKEKLPQAFMQIGWMEDEGVELTWFTNYLQNRQQKTIVRGTESTWALGYNMFWGTTRVHPWATLVHYYGKWSSQRYF